MLPFLTEEFGNASTIYSFGLNARTAIERARRQVAVALGAKPEEIVFTGSGNTATGGNGFWLRIGSADVDATVRDPAEPVELATKPRGEVEFREVRFRYAAAEPALAPAPWSRNPRYPSAASRAPTA